MNILPSKPIISVLTTVYNRELYLSECIESVINSSFNEWELIIVDDCSTDRSVTIARDYVRKDSRIRLFINDKNIGDYPNRNMAACYAKGNYIKFLDSDDIIYPYSLNIMMEAMEKFPKAGLALSFNVIDDLEPYPQIINSSDAYKSFFWGKNILGVGPSSTIIRRNCFENVGGFSGQQYVGDTELWLRIASKYPVVKLQPSLVWWRQHKDQQIKSELNNYDVLNIRYRLKMDALENCCNLLTDTEKEVAKKLNTYRHARTIWNLGLKKMKPKAAFRLFKDSGLKAWDLIMAANRRVYEIT